MSGNRPGRGRITQLTVDLRPGEATVVSLKVMTENGQNISHGTAARLLPWDTYRTIEAVAGEPIAFESGSLYEIVSSDTARVLMRSVPDAGTVDDMKIEMICVPQPRRKLNVGAEAAAFEQVCQLMSRTGIIDPPELLSFVERMHHELGIGNGMRSGG